MASRALRGWLLRLAGLAAVVWFLAHQLSWWDTLTLHDGPPLTGRVERLADGSWRVEAPDGTVRDVPAEAVEVRGGGAGSVPAVSWGLRTLGLRLGGHVGVLASVLVLFLCLLVLTAWRWRLLLGAVDLDLPLGRTVRLTFIGSFFNNAIPGATGGDVVKAYYAARSTGRGTRSVISVFVDRIVGLVGLAVLAGGVLLLAPGQAGYGPARTVVIGVLGAAVLGLVVLLTPPVRRALGLGRLVRRLPFQTLVAEARAALGLYRDQPLPLLVSLAASLVNHGVAAICVWMLAGGLGIQGLDVGMALALVPVANLFAAIPLLPGGWGVGELAFAYLFGQVGIPPTEAVSLSVVYRLSVLAASLPGGALWLFWRGRPTKAAILHEVDEATHAVEQTAAP